MSKIEFLVKGRSFCPKSKILTKIDFLVKAFDSKVEVFLKNRSFSHKSKFFLKNRSFSQKSKFFSKTFCRNFLQKSQNSQTILKIKFVLGHVFVNPIDHQAYMGMLCYKNASLTRQALRDKHSLTWEEFGTLLDSTKPANFISINFPLPEITPFAQGAWNFEIKDEKLVAVSIGYTI